jgi:hypothetical protein
VHNRTWEDADELALLYTVHIAGQPVLAPSAAEDMNLVSSTEVTAELGYPVITKAEREYMYQDVLSERRPSVCHSSCSGVLVRDHWTLYLDYPAYCWTS